MIHTEQLSRTFTSGSGKNKQTVEAVRELDLDVGPGRAGRLPRPQRRRQVDDPADAHHAAGRPPAAGPRVAGVDVVADPAGVRRRIGYIGQNPGAGYSYRVWDELLQQGRFYGLCRGGGDRAGQGARVLARASTASSCARCRPCPVARSAGSTSRSGSMHSPGLLFLDEPSTGMDPQNRANLWEHILRLREEHGTTMVLTTHYLEEADTMAERVVIIDHGRIIADDTAAALKAEQAGDRIGLTVGPRRRGRCAAEVAGQRGRGPVHRPRTPAAPTSSPGSSTATGCCPPCCTLALRHSRSRSSPPPLHQPTLDDVFLTLTGRSLREGAEA